MITNITNSNTNMTDNMTEAQLNIHEAIL